MVHREQRVPIVFAFTRRGLSRSLKRSAKTSCVAVLSHDGAGELFNALMGHTQAARRQYLEYVTYFPEDKHRSRVLVMRHIKELQKSISVDELMLHALAVKAEHEG